MKRPIALQCQLFQDLFLTEPTILHSQYTLSLPCFCPTCHFHRLEFCWCKSSFKLRNIDTTTFLNFNSLGFLISYEFSSLPSSAQHVSSLVYIGLSLFFFIINNSLLWIAPVDSHECIFQGWTSSQATDLESQPCTPKLHLLYDMQCLLTLSTRVMLHHATADYMLKEF